MKSITQIQLLGASNCDLGCSYCYLGKNCTFKNQDKNIVQSWIDGSYLENTKKVLEIFQSDPKQVISFQLWGGEPLLHIDVLQKAQIGTKLGQLFPGLQEFLIPTNFNNTNIESLVDFIYDLDKQLSPRTTDKRCVFHIQASIDGPPGDFNTYGHKVSWEKYMSNYNKIFEYIKTKEKLVNIEIQLNICPCSSQDLILKNLNTYEKIKDFRKHYDDFSKYLDLKSEEIQDICIIHVQTKSFYPRIAISQTTTSEEAMEIEKMIRLFDICEYQEKAYVIDKTSNANFYHDSTGITCYLNRNHECVESNEFSITLMPDGTIAQCPCLFFQNLDEFKNEYLKQNNFWDYKSSLIRENCFYNPLEEKDLKKIKDHDWYVRGGGYLGTHSTYINLNLNMAREMALSYQIDPNYIIDQELLLNHYLAAFQTAECYRENINCYHNFYIADINQFRRWFNGTTEYCFNTLKNTLKFGLNWEEKNGL